MNYDDRPTREIDPDAWYDEQQQRLDDEEQEQREREEADGSLR